LAASSGSGDGGEGSARDVVESNSHSLLVGRRCELGEALSGGVCGNTKGSGCLRVLPARTAGLGLR
jgi:hypothetical protein